MDQQDGLLIDGLDGNEAHRRSAGGFTNGGGIVEVVLAGAALVAIGGDEAGIDGPGIVAQRGEFTCPVMGAGTGLHGDEGGRRVGEELEQAGAVEGFSDGDVSGVVDAADREGILGQIDTEADNV